MVNIEKFIFHERHKQLPLSYKNAIEAKLADKEKIECAYYSGSGTSVLGMISCERLLLLTNKRIIIMDTIRPFEFYFIPYSKIQSHSIKDKSSSTYSRLKLHLLNAETLSIRFDDDTNMNNLSQILNTYVL